MRILSSRLMLAAALTVGVAAFSTAPTGGAMAAEFVAIKGGQVGGAYNRWTSAWSVYLTKALEGYQFSSEASTGSPENVRTAGSGDVEFAMAFANDVYNGYRGEGDFNKAEPDLRGVSFFFASVGHFIVPVDSEIKSLEDIKGKRVSLGGPGSGSALNMMLLLTHLGLNDQFTAVYLGGKSPQALQNGEIAAYNWHPGLGNAMIRDTATMMDIRFLNMDEPAKASGFYEKYPYFGSMVIPGGLYNNVEEDTPTFGTGSLLIANASVSPDLVYNVLKALDSQQGRKEISAAVGEADVKTWNKDVALNFLTIPLHPGAERFWKEKGLTIPAHLMSK